MPVESSSEDQIPADDAEAHKADGGPRRYDYISDGMRGQVKDFCHRDVFFRNAGQLIRWHEDCCRPALSGISV